MSNYKKEEKKDDYGKELLSWELNEYEKKENTKIWNLVLMILSAVVLLIAILTSNFLFALFIIIAIIVVMMNENKDSILVEFFILEDGILMGKSFYRYSEFENFSIVYIPRENIRQLYFEFKSSLRQRLSIPLYDVNPILVRETLGRFLEEDLEREDIPLSEQLGRMIGL